MLILFFCSLVSGLRIIFDPSHKLTQLSSEIDSSFSKLMKISFLDSDYWPILAGFSQARYYNFTQVLIATMEKIECDIVLDIIQANNFPLKQVFSSELLAGSGLSLCLNFLPDTFFNNSLQISPMGSSGYKATFWDPNRHNLFMKMAYERPRVNDNWYSWCFDPDISMDYIDWQSRTWAWKFINFNCIRAAPEEFSSGLLEILRPIDELILFNHPDKSILSRISGLVNSIAHGFSSNAEAIFATNQIMRIVTISTYLIIFPNNHVLKNRAAFLLARHLDNLEINRRKFLLRQELKIFIKNVLAPKEERDTLSQICTLLLTFMNFCSGSARSTWQLNIFLIWNYFRGTNYFGLNQFLDEFLTYFLAPESHPTAPDVCLFLRIVNSNISGPFDDNSTVERICSKFLFKKVSLSREIMKECPSEIPKNKRTVDSVFPLYFRLELLFKKTRFIDKFSANTIEFSFKNPPERSCLSLFARINYAFDASEGSILPINTKVLVRRGQFEGNLPEMLEIFFHNLMHTRWFDVFHSSRSTKPILLPNFTLPPHFMEFIGFLLGKAVISNVDVPFLIDERYFELKDVFERLEESSQTVTSEIQEMYPNISANYRSSLQVYRIIASLDLTASKVIQSITNSYTLGPMTAQEPKFVANIPYNIYRIVLMGSERLRMGLNRALPAELLTTSQLYELIFQ